MYNGSGLYGGSFNLEGGALYGSSFASHQLGGSIFMGDGSGSYGGLIDLENGNMLVRGGQIRLGDAIDGSATGGAICVQQGCIFMQDLTDITRIADDMPERGFHTISFFTDGSLNPVTVEPYVLRTAGNMIDLGSPIGNDGGSLQLSNGTIYTSVDCGSGIRSGGTTPSGLTILQVFTNGQSINQLGIDGTTPSDPSTPSGAWEHLTINGVDYWRPLYQ